MLFGLSLFGNVSCCPLEYDFSEHFVNAFIKFLLRNMLVTDFIP